MTALKKKDRVSFVFENKQLNGTLTKGGKKPSVIIDGSLSGISGPAHLFTPTDNQYSYEKSEVDKQITATVNQSTIQMNEGLAYEFTFYFNKKAVATLTDDASGGPLQLSMLQEKQFKKSEFVKLVESWFDFHFDLPEPMSTYMEGPESFECNLMTFGDWLVEYSWLPVTPLIAMSDSITSMIDSHKQCIEIQEQRALDEADKVQSTSDILAGKPEQYLGHNIEIYTVPKTAHRLAFNTATQESVEIAHCDWRGFVKAMELLGYME